MILESLFQIILHLRWQQLKRSTGDMNPLLWLPAAIIALALSARLQEWAVAPPGGWYVSAGAGLVLLGIHRSRRDLRFMQHLIRRPQWLWAGEYVVFSLPFAILILSVGNWQAAILWWLFCVAVPWLPVRPSAIRQQVFWGRVIPAGLYEWIAGMRKFGVLVLLFYVAALVSAFFVPYAALLLFWLVLATLGGFYQECEPRQLLLAAELPARQYIHGKIRSHIPAAWVLGAPVYVVYGSLHAEHGWVVLLFFVPASVMHLFFILNKYATYRPNLKNSGNSLLQSLVVLSVVIPFLLPLPLILCFRDYGRAVRNLDFYITAHYPNTHA